MVAHTCDPSLWEAEAGGLLQVQLGLWSETLSQKNNNKQNKPKIESNKNQSVTQQDSVAPWRPLPTQALSPHGGRGSGSLLVLAPSSPAPQSQGSHLSPLCALVLTQLGFSTAGHRPTTDARHDPRQPPPPAGLCPHLGSGSNGHPTQW